MRYQVFFVSVILILSAFALSAQSSKVDFSGKWVFNADQSEMGGPPGGAPGGQPPSGGTPSGGPPAGGRRGLSASKMVIAQEENKLTVEAFRQDFEGNEISTVSAYTLDGKESKNVSDFGTTTSVANWSEDGKTISIKSSMTMSRGDQTFTMESTEKYSLDKNMLVIETTRSTPMGDMTSKAVYDKEVE